jgi:hypothetical protein
MLGEIVTSSRDLERRQLQIFRLIGNENPFGSGPRGHKTFFFSAIDSVVKILFGWIFSIVFQGSSYSQVM